MNIKVAAFTESEKSSNTEILETYYWNNVQLDRSYGKPLYKYAVAVVL